MKNRCLLAIVDMDFDTVDASGSYDPDNGSPEGENNGITGWEWEIYRFNETPWQYDIYIGTYTGSTLYTGFESYNQKLWMDRSLEGFDFVVIGMQNS